MADLILGIETSCDETAAGGEVIKVYDDRLEEIVSDGF